MRVVGCISLNKDRPVHVRSVDQFGQLCLVWFRQNETQNLEDAVVCLGMNQVMDLVYALELPKTFKKCKAFDQVEFWKHSLAVAFISRSLARKVLTDFDDIESSFLPGLMHDVGIMVLDNIIPRDYSNFLTLKDLSSTDKPLELLEEEEFKTAHPEPILL